MFGLPEMYTMAEVQPKRSRSPWTRASLIGPYYNLIRGPLLYLTCIQTKALISLVMESRIVSTQRFPEQKRPWALGCSSTLSKNANDGR